MGNNCVSFYAIISCLAEFLLIIGINGVTAQTSDVSEATKTFQYLTSRIQYPYLISLQEGYRTGKHFCNGALIGRDSVLTAVLCCQKDIFHLSQIYAVGGSVFKDGGSGAVYNRVLFCVKHPKTSGIFQHNIALLRLEKPFSFNDDLRPIKMTLMPPPANVYLSAIGWGSSQGTEFDTADDNILKNIRLQIVDDEICDAKSLFPIYNNSYVFCAHVVANLFSTDRVCLYDYGTPLIYNYELFGISINNIACNDYSDKVEYVYFNKILYYRDWVNVYTPIEFRNREIPVKPANVGHSLRTLKSTNVLFFSFLYVLLSFLSW